MVEVWNPIGSDILLKPRIPAKDVVFGFSKCEQIASDDRLAECHLRELRSDLLLFLGEVVGAVDFLCLLIGVVLGAGWLRLREWLPSAFAKKIFWTVCVLLGVVRKVSFGFIPEVILVAHCTSKDLLLKSSLVNFFDSFFREGQFFIGVFVFCFQVSHVGWEV